ncbi:hypothetical protein ASPTUDRAFT_321209 [Aspergillus tubingensis CBS 134.48]|uniref:Uncharacterized protein n=1 Tax=Aspergillus tubingensis (strain CBS 134.48) TaxID=767770 RepID=A0A1L9NJB8_ASPTC|nr:hypothetical protein ASPTUDRAFT_321209 [Aspergillus tubingensis CBS 134.48]
MVLIARQILACLIFVVELVTIPRQLQLVYTLRLLAGLKLEHAFFDKAPLEIFSCVVHASVEDVVVCYLRLEGISER